jgi:hypothetical protein
VREPNVQLLAAELAEALRASEPKAEANRAAVGAGG